MNYVVIGGSSGIGKVLSTKLAEEGHTVYVASRKASERMESSDKVKVFDLDATDPDTDWSFLPDTIDGLVYAGGTINLKPFHRLKAEDFTEDMKVNHLGAVLTLQAAMKPLKASDNASVVLFSSVAAQKGLTFHSSVSSAKGAIEGLTKALSAEWAPKIRVNALALALTDTPMAEKLLNTDSKKEASNERHPLKRIGKPEDAAEMAAFLLSPKSSWITGQIIGVDGGMGAIQNI